MKEKVRQQTQGRFILLGCMLMLLALPMNAQQYSMEGGVAVGPSFYMGDANQHRLFADLRSSWNLLYRYNLNGRFSIKGLAGLTGVAGSTANQVSTFPSGVDLRFSRRVLDASAQLELNFYEYGMPDYVQGSASITPYISAGLGYMGFKTNKVETGVFLPIGLGLKVKLHERFNLGCEWSFRKTFTDRLDYAENTGGFQLDDPWLVESGLSKNKDWYSSITLNLSIDLFATQAKCYR